jgi:AraC-like DNA-binding protein
MHSLSVSIYYCRLRLITADLTIAGPGQRSAYTAWFMTDGSARLTTPSGPQLLRQGCAAITPPGSTAILPKGASVLYGCFDITHRERNVQETPRGYNTTIPQESMRTQPSWEVVTGIDLPALLDDGAALSIHSLMRDLRHEYWKSRGDHLIASAHLQLWLSHWIAHQLGRKESRRQKEWLSRAYHLIREAQAGERIGDIADAIGMSRSHFTTRFTQATGESPGHVLDQVRMTKARALLTKPRSIPLAKVAAQCGFSTVLSFGRSASDGTTA